MSAHTPAPWTWFTGKAAVDPSEAHVKFLMGANGQGFAHTVGLPEPEDTANANLLIVAPKLLAACKEALGAFERNDAIDWDEIAAVIAEAERGVVV